MNRTTIRNIAIASAIAGIVSPAAAATYSYDDDQAAQRTLYVQVADGETETFDTTWMAPSGASVTNLVKYGDGTLVIPNGTSLTAYSFDICVEDGLFKFHGTSVLGNTGTAHTITVCDGATLQNTAGGNNSGLGTKWTTHFTGMGHNGMGALYEATYTYGSPFGKWVLDGDAKAAMYGNGENDVSYVNLNGHILDLYLRNGYFINAANIENGGELRVHGDPANASFAEFRKWNNFYGGAENLISFSNTTWRVSSIRINGSALPGIDWSMAFDDKSAMQIRGGTDKTGGSSIPNTWRGPIEIRRDRLPLSVLADQGELGFAFTGAVSGGGFDLQGLDTTMLSLRLANAGNTFTNGVTGQYAELRLASNGTLPADGGALALTNSAVTLEDRSGMWLLPSASFSGDCVVSNGFGRWRELAKDGAGTLDYASSIGAETFQLNGGSMRLSLPPQAVRRRAVCAGLVEGIHKDYLAPGWVNDNRYTMLNQCVYKGTKPTVTNSVVSGMRLLYDSSTDEGNGWWTNRYITYSGYIWNNAATNQTWAFAGTSTAYWRLTIDGNFVMGWSNWSGSLKFTPNGDPQKVSTNLWEMAPGPHYIEYRTIIFPNGSNKAGPSMAGQYMKDRTEPNYNWDLRHGLMYNDSGVCTKNMDDYRDVIDPGDGSLLTCCLPDAMPASIGETALPEADLVFSNAVFAAGTTLVLSGDAQTFRRVEGWPTVTGGDVVVTDALAVDGGGLGSAAFAVSGSLTFGTGAALVPPDEDARPQDGGAAGEYVVGTAAGGIVDAPAAARNARWRVFVEGNAIKALFLPEQTLIKLR